MTDVFEDEFILYQHLYFEYKELTEELNKFSCRNEIKLLTEMIGKEINSRTLLGLFYRRKIK